jgi:hypothetical protein
MKAERRARTSGFDRGATRVSPNGRLERVIWDSSSEISRRRVETPIKEVLILEK